MNNITITLLGKTESKDMQFSEYMLKHRPKFKEQIAKNVLNTGFYRFYGLAEIDIFSTHSKFQDHT